MIRLLFFAQMRNLCGVSERSVTPEPGLTGERLWEALAGEFPALGALKGSVRLAVNGEFAAPGTPLRDGDEVVFITPVSGG